MWSSAGEAVTVVGSDEAAGDGEGGKPLAEGGVSHAAGRAELRERHRLVRLGEGAGDALVHGGRRWLSGRAVLDDLERQGVAALGELEGDGRDGRRGAVLDGQGEIIAVAAKVEVGVSPGVKLGGAAQCLAGADPATPFAATGA